ncbi:ATP-binding protein [Microbacterium sp. ARD31]|uniref:ATP-binding protein n=1 Tax=Microbacterium sp. ARD31 TaxID=2962576 RepID=UPI0028820676|nr:ATP-binding protein [Microbacterium sp. ARD31]MDT0182020.1 ATP-binding protein [Microbacterium sp. ARD31]
MDPRDDDFLKDLHRLVQRLNRMPEAEDAPLTPLGERVADHLGADPTALPMVSESVPPHRLVDLDLALDALAGDDAEVLGLRGGQHLRHEEFAGLLASPYARIQPGPVEYVSVPTGPDTSRQTKSTALRLFRVDGMPVAALQRAADPQTGRETASLDVVAASPAVGSGLLAEVRRLMAELSVVRGNVVSFARGEFGHHGIGKMTFLERPTVTADQVILPDGLLDRIRAHVVDIGGRAGDLRARGQHLKRGVLLYGPPGTGKTLTIRHLIHETPGTTVVLLQGAALGLIGEAAALARAMSPALVVLEDVDLVAADRGDFGLQPLLFEVLDALDGLDGDADVAFVLTTNRAEILEPALAARPGRVDLALEIPLPDLPARQQLFQVYGGGLPLSAEALATAAERAEGVTASFVKEVIRRAVLRAVSDDRDVTDDDLAVALDAMLEDTRGISRVLFGGDAAADAQATGGHGSAEFGMFG